MDIILGRANANKQLVRFLKEAIASYGLASYISKGAQLAMHPSAKPSRS